MAIAVNLLAGLAAASPVLQPRGVSDACAVQPDGYGALPTPNTAYGFVHYGAFTGASTIATAPTGYQRTFHIQLAATTVSVMICCRGFICAKP